MCRSTAFKGSNRVGRRTSGAGGGLRQRQNLGAVRLREKVDGLKRAVIPLADGQVGMQANFQCLAARQGVTHGKAGLPKHPLGRAARLLTRRSLSFPCTGCLNCIVNRPRAVLSLASFLAAISFHCQFLIRRRKQNAVRPQRGISLKGQFTHAAVEDIDLEIMLDREAVRGK